jgi:hypothetical protein
MLPRNPNFLPWVLGFDDILGFILRELAGGHHDFLFLIHIVCHLLLVYHFSANLTMNSHLCNPFSGIFMISGAQGDTF